MDGRAAAKSLLLRGRQYALWLYLTGQASTAVGWGGVGAGAYFHNALLITGGVCFGLHGFNRARRHVLYRVERAARNNGGGHGPRLV